MRAPQLPSGPCVGCGEVTELACVHCYITNRSWTWLCSEWVCTERHANETPDVQHNGVWVSNWCPDRKAQA